MGEIITKKVINKKVRCKILLDIKEFENLKGNLKEIHLFSSELCAHPAEINTRGNHGVTKYAKIPLSIRPKKKPLGELKYLKIKTPSKEYFIYSIEK